MIISTHTFERKEKIMQGLNIGIVGCGWLGIRLADKWAGNNNIYTTTTRLEKLAVLSSKGLNPVLADFNGKDVPAEVVRWPADLSLDLTIVTVPVSTRRDNNETDVERRIKSLSVFMGHFSKQVFFLSSTSVYPDQERCFTEEDMPWEEVKSEALFRRVYPQANILRLGGLMGDDRFLSKYKVSNLNAPVNHVHFEDVIALIERMVGCESSSMVYNVVAPVHPAKEEVISVQKGGDYITNPDLTGRTVSSEKLMKDLKYGFLYPDPRLFPFDAYR